MKAKRLTDCAMRQTVVLIGIDLPDRETEYLLERGVIPGCTLCTWRHTPTGDPIVRVDGMLLAMRREMAERLLVQDAAVEAAA